MHNLITILLLLATVHWARPAPVPDPLSLPLYPEPNEVVYLSTSTQLKNLYKQTSLITLLSPLTIEIPLFVLLPRLPRQHLPLHPALYRRRPSQKSRTVPRTRPHRTALHLQKYVLSYSQARHLCWSGQ